TLREIHNKTPGAEYLEWAIAQGVFARGSSTTGSPPGEVTRGPRFGDVRRFCASDEELGELCAVTPAAHALETAGPRAASVGGRRGVRACGRGVWMHRAWAGEAGLGGRRLEAGEPVGPFRRVHTRAASKEEHFAAPDLGAHLAEQSARTLGPEPCRIQMLISD